MQKLKRILTLVALAAGVFLCIAVIAFFAFRNLLLNKAIEKAQVKIKNNYQLNLTVAKAEFTGIAGVTLNNVAVVPSTPDTLFAINEFNIQLKPFYLLFGDVRIDHINLNNGFLQFIKVGDYSNFSSVFGSTQTDSINNENKPVETAIDDEKVNYAEKGYKLLIRLLNKVPNQVMIKNFMLKVLDEDRYVNFNLENLLFDHNQINSLAHVQSNYIDQYWVFSGFANPKARTANFSLTTTDTTRVLLPYILKRFNLKTGFDSVRFVLEGIDFENEELKIVGQASIKNFLVNHPKLAKEDVIVSNAEFNYRYTIGENYFALDSTSKVVFNGVSFYPFAKITTSPDTSYWLTIKTDQIQAQDFINSLPAGMFENIKGMQAEGSFSYRLDFMLNENKPNDLIFESTLVKNQLKINQYGKANLAKLNNDFIYTPLENGRPMRPILVGADNPFFTTLDQISDFLKKCVLTSEDPSFFWHRGFVTEAFKQSIVKNLKTGKFKRGASTISMQLMKNVFLTREKTMSRKLEEILLVYILENNYLVSKDRMFEVYLNIIEWGPNIYGIGEACDFYFGKKPAQLTLSESLFLASIIPSPKKFMWRFDTNGNTRNWLQKSFRFMNNKMIVRQLILPDDTIGFNPMINITGRARKLIIKSDTLSNDSLLEIDLNQADED